MLHPSEGMSARPPHLNSLSPHLHLYQANWVKVEENGGGSDEDGEYEKEDEFGTLSMKSIDSPFKTPMTTPSMTPLSFMHPYQSNHRRQSLPISGMTRSVSQPVSNSYSNNNSASPSTASSASSSTSPLRSYPHASLPHSASASSICASVSPARPASCVTSVVIPSRQHSTPTSASSSLSSSVVLSVSALSPPARSYSQSWNSAIMTNGSTVPSYTNPHMSDTELQRHQRHPHHPEHSHSHPNTMPLPNRSIHPVNPAQSASCHVSPLHLSSQRSQPNNPAHSFNPPSPTLIAFTSHSDPRYQRIGARLYECSQSRSYDNHQRRRTEEFTAYRTRSNRMLNERAGEHRHYQSELNALRESALAAQADREARVAIRLLGAIYDPGRGIRESRRRYEALRRLNEERRRMELEKAKYEAELAEERKKGMKKLSVSPKTSSSNHSRSSSSSTQHCTLLVPTSPNSPLPMSNAATPKRTSVIATLTSSNTSIRSNSNPSQHSSSHFTAPSSLPAPVLMGPIHNVTGPTTKVSPIMRAKYFFSSLFSRRTPSPNSSATQTNHQNYSSEPSVGNLTGAIGNIPSEINPTLIAASAAAPSLSSSASASSTPSAASAPPLLHSSSSSNLSQQFVSPQLNSSPSSAPSSATAAAKARNTVFNSVQAALATLTLQKPTNNLASSSQTTGVTSASTSYLNPRPLHSGAHTPTSLRSGASPRLGATVLTPTYPRTPSALARMATKRTPSVNGQGSTSIGLGMSSPDLEFGLGGGRSMRRIEDGWNGVVTISTFQSTPSQSHPCHPSSLMSNDGIHMNSSSTLAPSHDSCISQPQSLQLSLPAQPPPSHLSQASPPARLSLNTRQSENGMTVAASALASVSASRSMSETSSSSSFEPRSSTFHPSQSYSSASLDALSPTKLSPLSTSQWQYSMSPPINSQEGRMNTNQLQ